MGSISPEEAEERLQAFALSLNAIDVVCTFKGKDGDQQPEVLFVLDSCFNPPTNAHMALVISALQSLEPDQLPSARLLLLFSTNGTDEPGSPASFAQRLVLMARMAEDLRISFDEPCSHVSIDIGVTIERLQVGKSRAISAVAESTGGSRPRQIHLLGYDNLTRVLQPQWYPASDPPLQALSPFFDNNCHLRCTMRFPSGEELGGDLSFQRQNGEFEKLLASASSHGFKEEWIEQITLVRPSQAKAGTSSTAVRQAAHIGDW